MKEEIEEIKIKKEEENKNTQKEVVEKNKWVRVISLIFLLIIIFSFVYYSIYSIYNMKDYSNAYTVERKEDNIIVRGKEKDIHDIQELYLENKKLRKLMRRECIFLMTIGVVFSRLAYSKEGEKQYKDLWKQVKEKNPKLYHSIRYCTMATWVSFPTRVGRWVSLFGYRLAHHLVNFN